MNTLHIATLGCSAGLSLALILTLLRERETVRNFVLALTMAGLLACATGCSSEVSAPQSSTETQAAATPTVPGGAACDLGTQVVMGCDGVAHASTIVRYTLPDGDIVTCWEGQATSEPVALSCPAGTACVVFDSSGQHSGTCR